jgi:cytochrome b561
LDGDRIDGDELGWAVLHIAVGLTVLVLAFIRLGVRLTRGAPEPHRDKAAVLIWLGSATHWLLYGFILFMPVSGALAWFGRAEFSADAHEFGRLVLVPLILLHAAGAFAEHFVFRNDTLKRMLRPTPEA